MKYHYIELILNFIGTISWPVVCLIIISYFRKPISRFLKSIKKLSYGDATIERSNKKQKDENKKIDILTKGNDFTYIDETLNKFSEFSKNRCLDIIEKETKISEVQDPNQKLERLRKYTQLLIFVRSSEKIYHLIYGSQIRLLQKLNYSAENVENIKYFYDNAVEYFPEAYKDYSYNNYLDFLVSFELITYNRDTNVVSITEAGKDFLRYIVESNSNVDKLY